MFERGDFVRVKPETILDTGEIAENWGGEIFHVDEENGLYGMGVDLSSEEAIEAYLMKKQMAAFAQQPREPVTRHRPKTLSRKDLEQNFGAGLGHS
ncbi:hypothetical protein [Phaeodactylibacter xiamenensis]|jgi:hypothetical protein|uniref:hypothetical protein n=1 Tax=Phaeodactylibacter xiamenensis TaxID=1524460 RepID=UPI003CCBE4EE